MFPRGRSTNIAIEDVHEVPTICNTKRNLRIGIPTQRWHMNSHGERLNNRLSGYINCDATDWNQGKGQNLIVGLIVRIAGHKRLPSGQASPCDAQREHPRSLVRPVYYLSAAPPAYQQRTGTRNHTTTRRKGNYESCPGELIVHSSREYGADAGDGQHASGINDERHNGTNVSVPRIRPHVLQHWQRECEPEPAQLQQVKTTLRLCKTQRPMTSPRSMRLRFDSKSFLSSLLRSAWIALRAA